MCGICGAINLRGELIPDLDRQLAVMSELVAHRGPDDAGIWTHAGGHVGLAHRRLSIIDIDGGHQPMTSAAGNCIAYNGEVYNYIELRRELGLANFRGTSDTEVVLRAHEHWGTNSLERLRGMFAYALWDERAQELICARDRFGIKPFYYARVGEVLYFASEAKALLPFLPSIQTDLDALKDYLTFQFCLAGKTLFKDIRELPAAHYLRAGAHAVIQPSRYWEIHYDIDFNHTGRYFEQEVRRLLEESAELHMRSDVPVSAYVSGGLDSSVVASLSAFHADQAMHAFTGRFAEKGYDEGAYAHALADARNLRLHDVDIDVDDFVTHLHDVIFHLDYPVAGPGSFPQFMVSREASRHTKVVVGGQGGDEVFGGYTRYLVAYFEQCIKAAIDGTMQAGNFVVTYQSIIPNLVALQNYKPMLQEFWREGLFGDLAARYFKLINRTPELAGEVDLDALGPYSPFETFQEIFNGSNVGHEAYFDKMTHFDFKTLLPALLQVEDRVSMAHGLESRLPLLDHRLVELAATIPADIKFTDGAMKHIFRVATRELVPPAIADRKDKMGFPVPLTDWMCGPARDFVADILSTDSARTRGMIDNERVLEGLSREGRFGRKTWGLLCLEIWQQTFHDRESHYKGLLSRAERADG
jgi:asparagine synthase (glutamine-hydrolysing)